MSYLGNATSSSIRDVNKDLFVAGTSYTKNVSTSLMLSDLPAKPNTVKVFFNGVYQNKDTYYLVGSTINFGVVGTPAVIDADSVEVQYEIPSQFVGLSPAEQAVLTDAVSSAISSANTAVANATASINVASALSAPGGSALVGYQAAGAEAVPRTLEDKARERVDIRDFGAEINTPANNVSLAIIKALAAHNTVIIPAGNWYGGPADATQENLVVMMASGKTVIFEDGAKFYFNQSGLTYLPLFAAVGTTGWKIVNPTFVATGQISVNASGDIKTADVSIPNPVSRLGSAYSYEAYTYCSAIWVDSCHGFEIVEFDYSATSPINCRQVGIFTARTYGGGYEVNGASFADLNNGVLAQGGLRGVFRDLKTSRLNQDIGIPGHTVYSFLDETIIDGVIDSGEESGITSSSHTISYKGGGILSVSNVFSKRVEGLCNWYFADSEQSFSFSNVVWEDDTYPDRKGANSAMYGTSVVPLTNAKVAISLSSVILSTEKDVPLIGGYFVNAIGSLVLRRKDNTPPTKAFMRGRLIGSKLDIVMEQLGTFDAPVHQGQGAEEQGMNDWNISLIGFNSAPIFENEFAVPTFRHNRVNFVTDARNSAPPNGFRRYLGSPSQVFPNRSVISAGENIVTINGSYQWKIDNAPTTSVVNNFPLPGGNWIVNVMIVDTGQDWFNSSTFLVCNIRPGTTTGNSMFSAVQLGTSTNRGGSWVVAPVITGNSYTSVTVTIGITNATSQSNSTYVVFSATPLLT